MLIPKSAGSMLRSAIGVLFTLVALVIAFPAHATEDPEGPAHDALKDFREKSQKPRAAIENRFFLKKRRWEVAPIFGYVPNNPFARRYVGGLIFGHHFNEVIAAEAQITFSPDLGETDLKGLTTVLIDRAENASAVADADFQQPLDKITLSAAFGIAWAPIYGKINLVGETVLNFDFYGFLGVAMLSKTNYNAVYDTDGANPEANDIVLLQLVNNEFKVSPVLGVGLNIFVTQSIAIKLDARFSLYVDNKPQYDPDVPVPEQQLYSNFITSAGVSFFFPRMKSRLYNF
ncbi:MAG: outer membrane beta-barrel domain-containing protein [Proteobacteria bacterium]|jgi:outer membrane beta-barrel protein|nr:outer membrane beta-barrel domain-containing protein [Pseudomonadota bacterium]